MFRRIECKISAERIGYSYLMWVGRIAMDCGLKGIGFVRPDGSIEVIAEGDDQALTKFTKKIQHGRPLADAFSTIDNFSVTWHEPTHEYQDFSIQVKD